MVKTLTRTETLTRPSQLPCFVPQNHGNVASLYVGETAHSIHAFGPSASAHKATA